MKNLTTVIQIGNTDDKLPQWQWSRFYELVDDAVKEASKAIYFSGASHPSAKWQNAAWMCDVSDVGYTGLISSLRYLCSEFGQDSIAVTNGETIFVSAYADVPPSEDLK